MTNRNCGYKLRPSFSRRTPEQIQLTWENIGGFCTSRRPTSPSPGLQPFTVTWHFSLGFLVFLKLSFIMKKSQFLCVLPLLLFVCYDLRELIVTDLCGHFFFILWCTSVRENISVLTFQSRNTSRARIRMPARTATSRIHQGTPVCCTTVRSGDTVNITWNHQPNEKKTERFIELWFKVQKMPVF